MSAELPSYPVVASYATQPLLLQVLRPLNIRDAASTTGRRIVGIRPPAQLRAIALLDGESINDNRRWYRSADDQCQFFWSGGVEPVMPPLPPTDSLPVKRRTNGTILPLKGKELRDVFGEFEARELNAGQIEIDPAWVDANITTFAHSLLTNIGLGSVRVHRRAKPYFDAVFNEIAADPAMAECVRTCGGTFVPRHIGSDRNKDLSSHSWGIAIDLNVHWNAYHSQPAPLGAIGSVRELVPVFAKYGFAWGGHFSDAFIDGMHFELALCDLDNM